jgi:glutaredoxin
LSDFWPHGQVAQTYGVLRSEGYSERALFIIDKNCTIRYVDVHNIDEQPDNEVLFQVLAGIERVPVPPPVEAEIPPAQPAAPAQSPQQAKLVMYCTQWCPACRRARAFFKQYDVPFDEIDITRDRAAAARVRGWANGYETTPVFDVNGTILVNFNQARLAELLGIGE